jgi:adenine-specific DNA glycosylase
MDLGATCARAAARLRGLPVARAVAARILMAIPRATLRAQQRRSTAATALPHAGDRNPRGEFLLEKRPPSGILGRAVELSANRRARRPGAVLRAPDGETQHRLPSTVKPFQHTFSPLRLLAEPVLLRVTGNEACAMEAGRLAWYKPGSMRSVSPRRSMRLIDALSSRIPEGIAMSRTVHMPQVPARARGPRKAPLSGSARARRIFETVSKQAWQDGSRTRPC